MIVIFNKFILKLSTFIGANHSKKNRRTFFKFKIIKRFIDYVINKIFNTFKSFFHFSVHNSSFCHKAILLRVSLFYHNI